MTEISLQKELHTSTNRVRGFSLANIQNVQLRVCSTDHRNPTVNIGIGVTPTTLTNRRTDTKQRDGENNLKEEEKERNSFFFFISATAYDIYHNIQKQI